MFHFMTLTRGSGIQLSVYRYSFDRSFWSGHRSNYEATLLARQHLPEELQTLIMKKAYIEFAFVFQFSELIQTAT